MEYLLLFVGLVALANIYIKLALRYNIVDKPNNRSSHIKETVRGGGIIFPISALGWFIYSGCQFPLFFTGLIIISAISFWDDLSPVSSKLRLIIHLGVLLLLFAEIQLYKLPLWSWGPALILSTWIINAYNFMDGINGITGGYSFSVFLGLWIVNNYQVGFIGNDLIYFMMVPLIVFSYFNFRINAKCFAGDVGSISMAYVIVFLLAKLIIKSGNWLYLLFLSVYGVDTVITILHRLMQKEDIFVAHRKHIYQLLVNELKISHLTIASYYSFVQLLICLIIFVVLDNSDSFLVGLTTGISIMGILIFVYYVAKIQIYKKIKVIGTSMQN
jgi:UDP-N-acetylmuramyl pentapeptide phosphotransferase/UDP-N-acetylglucosamine-1-phosphate transferase